MRRTKAIFLDRDGTIIRHVPYLHEPAKVKIISNAARAIKLINRLGFLAIVITNQPVIAHGLIDPVGVDHIHALIIRRLAKKGAKVDAVYFCPHHPNGTVKKYKLRCRCRKPNTGMIIKAVRKFNIDIKKSFVVGDETADVMLGKKAGLRSILIKTGRGGKDAKFKVAPDFHAQNLNEAIKLIKLYA